jgi:uncharacterized cupin superfamily protein
MGREAKLTDSEHGRTPEGVGWFVLNAKDAPWRHREGRGAVCYFEGPEDFDQLGINVIHLGAGEAMGMYHWEADQEDFLVVSGDATLIVEGEERPLRQWDLFHCPPNTGHIIVGGPAVVVAVGAREHDGRPDWGGYRPDATAARYGASVERETTAASEAYAAMKHRELTAFREGWLPG